jgi:hypothetical protein
MRGCATRLYPYRHIDTCRKTIRVRYSFPGSGRYRVVFVRQVAGTCGGRGCPALNCGGGFCALGDGGAGGAGWPAAVNRRNALDQGIEAVQTTLSSRRRDPAFAGVPVEAGEPGAQLAFCAMTFLAAELKMMLPRACSEAGTVAAKVAL